MSSHDARRVMRGWLLAAIPPQDVSSATPLVERTMMYVPRSEVT